MICELVLLSDSQYLHQPLISCIRSILATPFVRFSFACLSSIWIVRLFASESATAFGRVLDMVCSIQPYGYERSDWIVRSGFWSGESDSEIITLDSGWVLDGIVGISRVIFHWIDPLIRRISGSTGGVLIWRVFEMLSRIFFHSRTVIV